MYLCRLGLCMPISWKESNIIPIPEVTKPTCESDIRPISLTPCLSKVLHFVVSWLIEDVRDKIDHMQFGCLKGTSTSYCLLEMVHNWLLQLNSLNEHLRVCFLDFSKAFHRIGYNILVQKLINLNVRLCLIPWIITFLSDRKQRVKLNQTFSEWLPVKAGTKLGPILFLIMVNDLGRVMSPNFGMWKYVDDVSLSENPLMSRFDPN